MADLKDLFAGTVNSNLTAHTSDSGHTWSALAGTIELDANGYVFTQSGGSPAGSVYKSSWPSGASGNPITVTFDIKYTTAENQDYIGAGVVDSSGNNYHLTSLYSGNSGGGWALEKEASGGGSRVTIGNLPNTPLSINTVYSCVLSYQVVSGTVVLTVLVSTGGVVVWRASFTDSSYTTCQNVSIRGFLTSGADSSTTGYRLGNLAATSPTIVAMTDANIFYSPGNWLTGATPASPNSGSYLKFGFNGTGCILNLNTTTLGANAAYLKYSVDGLPWIFTNISGISSLAIIGGQASGNHQVFIGYAGRTVGADAWSGNPPTDAWKPIGLVVVGGTTTVAPVLLSGRMLVFTDSRGEAYDVLGPQGTAVVQDAFRSAAFMWAESQGCEVGLVGYSGQGWTIGGQTNVPPIFTPGNDTLSSWNKLWAGQARSFSGLTYLTFLNLGGNDTRNGASDAAVTATVSGVLAAVRAQNGSMKIFDFPSYEGDKFSAIQTGHTNYQTATPDPTCFFRDIGLSTAQKSAINANSGSAANATFITSDGIHPDTYGQSLVGSHVVQVGQLAQDGLVQGAPLSRLLTGM